MRERRISGKGKEQIHVMRQDAFKKMCEQGRGRFVPDFCQEHGVSRDEAVPAPFLNASLL